MQLTKEQLDALRKAYRLSPRETQVLDLLVQGLATNLEIGQRLGTTPGAVGAAVQSIFGKTQSRSRHEVVMRAMAVVFEQELRREMAARLEDREKLAQAIRDQILAALRRRS
jgi:DNA-binding CsgD family transcriptional regulator